MALQKKKKLVILAGPLDNQSAGIHVYTRELIRHLHQQDNLPFEIVLIRDRQSNEYPKFKTIKIPLYTWLPGFASLRLFFIVPFVCTWIKANIVLEPAHFGPFNLPPWIKRVTVIHDLTPIIFPEWHPFAGWFLQKLFIPGILHRSHLIIAVSHSTKSDIIRLFPKVGNKIKVTHLGISEDFNPIKDLSILDKWNISQPFILSVGTIEPRKNHKLVLKAFEILKADKAYQNLKWVIVGSKGWKIDGFLKKVQNSKFSDDIIFAGHIPRKKLVNLYSLCSVFIYPSHYEGFGFPILEAMACGAHIITTNNSSIPEIGKDYVDYVEENDHEELIRLVKNKLQSGDALDIKKVEYAKSYTWEKCSRQVVDYLTALS